MFELAQVVHSLIVLSSPSCLLQGGPRSLHKSSCRKRKREKQSDVTCQKKEERSFLKGKKNREDKGCERKIASGRKKHLPHHRHKRNKESRHPLQCQVVTEMLFCAKKASQSMIHLAKLQRAIFVYKEL